jgi:hypothetical protein
MERRETPKAADPPTRRSISCLEKIGSIIIARSCMHQEKKRREAKVNRRSDEGDKGTP